MIVKYDYNKKLHFTRVSLFLKDSTSHLLVLMNNQHWGKESGKTYKNVWLPAKSRHRTIQWGRLKTESCLESHHWSPSYDARIRVREWGNKFMLPEACHELYGVHRLITGFNVTDNWKVPSIQYILQCVCGIMALYLIYEYIHYIFRKS